MTTAAALRAAVYSSVQHIIDRCQNKKMACTPCGMPVTHVLGLLKGFAARRDYDNSLRCVLQLEAIALCFGQVKTSIIQYIRTQTLNQLLSVFLEECMDPGLVVAVYDLARSFKRNIIPEGDWVGSTLCLLNLLDVVCSARRGRYAGVVARLASVSTAKGHAQGSCPLWFEKDKSAMELCAPLNGMSEDAVWSSLFQGVCENEPAHALSDAMHALYALADHVIAGRRGASSGHSVVVCHAVAIAVFAPRDPEWMGPTVVEHRIQDAVSLLTTWKEHLCSVRPVRFPTLALGPQKAAGFSQEQLLRQDELEALDAIDDGDDLGHKSIDQLLDAKSTITKLSKNGIVPTLDLSKVHGITKLGKHAFMGTYNGCSVVIKFCKKPLSTVAADACAGALGFGACGARLVRARGRICPDTLRIEPGAKYVLCVLMEPVCSIVNGRPPTAKTHPMEVFHDRACFEKYLRLAIFAHVLGIVNFSAANVVFNLKDGAASLTIASCFGFDDAIDYFTRPDRELDMSLARFPGAWESALRDAKAMFASAGRLSNAIRRIAFGAVSLSDLEGMGAFLQRRLEFLDKLTFA